MEMTMQDFLHEYVLPVMGLDADTDDYDDFIVPVGNVVLQECFELNNGFRRSLGLEPFDRFVILDSEGIIPFEQEIMLKVCLYGIAAALMIDEADDEASKYQMLLREYTVNKEDYERYQSFEVVSRYVVC